MCTRKILAVVATALLMLPALAWARQDDPVAAQGSAVPSDPGTRLFFGATGRSLPRGESYVGLYEFGFGLFQVGVTDRFSIGAGGPPLAGGRVVAVTPKLQVYRDRSTSAAVGVLHLTAFTEDGIGVAYGVATTGSSDTSVTGGLGVGYFHCRGRTSRALVALIGGEHRISPRVKLVTENYVFSEVLVTSVVVRLTRGRFSTDLGVLAPIADGQPFFGPLVNFAWTFRKH